LLRWVLNELQRPQNMEDIPAVVKGSLRDALNVTDEVESKQDNLVV
jgi:hypothetical protein